MQTYPDEGTTPRPAGMTRRARIVAVDLSNEIDVMRRAVRIAAGLCAAVSSESPTFAKPGGEPVTVADFGSQAILLEALANGFPRDAVRAEETSVDLAAVGAVDQVTAAVGTALGRPVAAGDVAGWMDHRGGESGRLWAVDPIDGTKGMLRGEQYAIAAGLIMDGTAVLGVLGCPRLELSGIQGVLVWGGPGIGAFVGSLGEGKTRPLSVSAVADPTRARILGSVESAHGDPEVLRRIVDRLRIAGGVVRIDSQAKYAAVAAGMADLYVRPRNRVDWREMVWDHAAGAAIVAGAGGTVTDLDGRALDFSTGSLLQANRGVLVSNGALHDTVLAALAEIG